MTGPTIHPGVLQRYALLFWDFDGVIKESVGVKSDAFGRLFAPFGREVAARVREHHERHGGMSRYEKLPLYLEWSGCPDPAAQLARYCELFSLEVRQAVIDCPWVPGAREYLESNHERQAFILVSATPQEEMESILRALLIDHCFREVYGAPTHKADAIASALRHCGCRGEEALLIGDSSSDCDAARAAGVDFLLRCTALNGSLQQGYAGPRCENFGVGAGADDALSSRRC